MSEHTETNEKPTQIEMVKECLEQSPEQKFTVRELAEWIMENYSEAMQEKKDNAIARGTSLHTKEDLRQQLVAEIGSRRAGLQKKYPHIKTTEGRPRKYYFTQDTDSTEVKKSEQSATSKSTAEHDLYLPLIDFLQSEYSIYSKRIDEKKSRNTRGPKGNQWLHPDVVSLETLDEDWDPEIKACVKEHKDKQVKLWSFEVKVLVNQSNLRQAFFQTVSNSSWANYGYLVAATLTLGPEALKELRMLSSLHGIGFIRLNTEDPEDNETMIPATERGIDWDTANRLARQNKDFWGYVKTVKEFYQTGSIKPDDWDSKSLLE